MRHLLVYGHPTRDAYTGWALDTLAADLRLHDGHRVSVRDLSTKPLEPHLTRAEYEASLGHRYGEEIREEFDLLHAHDTLTLVFPLWWMGFPARLKGWLDRVLAYGLAYELDGETPIPKLAPRRAATLVTHGSPSERYERDGARAALEHAWGEHIFRFCGLEPVGHAWLGNAVHASKEARGAHRREIRALADSLASAG